MFDHRFTLTTFNYSEKKWRLTCWRVAARRTWWWTWDPDRPALRSWSDRPTPRWPDYPYLRQHDDNF